MMLNEAAGAFRAALETVWGTSAAHVYFEVTVDFPPDHGVLAALRCDRSVARVDGRTLLAHASNHTLALAPRLLERRPDEVRRVLLHEAIHVGRPRHDAEFKRIATSVGAALTEQELEGVFKVERQLAKGKHFRVVHTTCDKEEALAFAMGKQGGPGRYRIVY